MSHKTDSRQKVLFFLFGSVGGAERMTINIGKNLPRERFDVRFVVCGRLTGIWDFIPSDYPAYSIPWLNIFVFPRIRIARLLLREKPDFVFSSTMALNVRLLQTAHLLKCRCIVRNDSMLQIAGTMLKLQMKLSYRYAYRIIAQQEEMGVELRGFMGKHADRVHVVHNLLDRKYIDDSIADCENPFPANGKVKYVCITNFSRVKAPDIAVRSFSILHGRQPDSELYLVGRAESDNPLLHEVQQLIEKDNLKESVYIVGYDSNPYRWEKFADCLLLTSRLEGLPNVLVESQYLGTPVVATRCIPMIDRIVKDGVNGYTVPVGDVEKIADAMLKAPQLGRVKLSYHPSAISDFEKIFT